MDKLKTNQNGIYRLFVDRDLGYMQDSLALGANATLDGMLQFANTATPSTPDNCFIISGCVASGTSLSAGWIYYKGEVLQVDAQTISVARPLVFTVSDNPHPTLDPSTMDDLSSANIHRLRRGVMVSAAGDSAAGTDAFRWEDITRDMAAILFEPRWVFDPTLLNAFGSNGKGTGSWRRWALCDGRNGTPDLRKRVVVGQDRSVSGSTVDTDFSAINNAGGAKNVLLTANQSGLREHAHKSGDPGTNNAATGGTNQVVPVDNSGSLNTSKAGPLDAIEAHENMPPYIVLAPVCRIV